MAFSNLSMLGGGNRKKSLVNSWMFPSVPARFLPTSINGVNPTYSPWPTAGPKTFSVSNNGIGNYIINGKSNTTLSLKRGLTYTFNINAEGHPFWINTISTLGTDYAFNDGVTNNGASSSTLTFVVPNNAPSKLYYNCQYHITMAGIINIA